MYDSDLQLKDAGLVAASAAAQVDEVNQILNLGTGKAEGILVVDVSAIEIASNDEIYTIRLQGSSESDFSSDYEDLLSLELGAAEVLAGDVDSTTGQYELPFTTEKNGTVYPYVRLYTTVAGAVATGINYAAHLIK